MLKYVFWFLLFFNGGFLTGGGGGGGEGGATAPTGRQPFTPKVKSTFPQPFREKCISEVVRIGRYNHLSSE